MGGGGGEGGCEDPVCRRVSPARGLLSPLTRTGRSWQHLRPPGPAFLRHFTPAPPSDGAWCPHRLQMPAVHRDVSERPVGRLPHSTESTMNSDLGQRRVRDCTHGRRLDRQTHRDTKIKGLQSGRATEGQMSPGTLPSPTGSSGSLCLAGSRASPADLSRPASPPRTRPLLLLQGTVPQTAATCAVSVTTRSR